MSDPEASNSKLSDGLDGLLEAASPGEQLAYELAIADIELLEELRAARIRRGLSQEELAAIIGVDPARVREFEGGLTEPTLSTVRRYAHALSVTISHSVADSTADSSR